MSDEEMVDMVETIELDRSVVDGAVYGTGYLAATDGGSGFAQAQAPLTIDTATDLLRAAQERASAHIDEARARVLASLSGLHARRAEVLAQLSALDKDIQGFEDVLRVSMPSTSATSPSPDNSAPSPTAITKSIRCPGPGCQMMFRLACNLGKHLKAAHPGLRYRSRYARQ